MSMAPPAIIGLSRKPKKGNKIPAAIGIAAIYSDSGYRRKQRTQIVIVVVDFF